MEFAQQSVCSLLIKRSVKADREQFSNTHGYGFLIELGALANSPTKEKRQPTFFLFARARPRSSTPSDGARAQVKGDGPASEPSSAGRTEEGEATPPQRGAAGKAVVNGIPAFGCSTSECDMPPDYERYRAEWATPKGGPRFYAECVAAARAWRAFVWC